MEKVPDHKVQSEREKSLILLRDLHDCENVANYLGLKGQGVARLCPKCSAGKDASDKTLSLRQRFFECSRCDFRGDVIELVQGTRNCTVDEAVAFLTDAGVKAKKAAKAREKTEAEFAALAAAGAACKIESDRVIIARRAFLTQCPPICEDDLATLRGSGVSNEVAAHFQLRNGPLDPAQTLRRLIASFGILTLVSSGLIEQSPEMVQGEKQYNLVFHPYDRERLQYIVVPYLEAGKPVFLRAIPMLPAEERPRRDMPPTIGTSENPPCPFNIDALNAGSTLFIFRREVEAMAATSAGFAAIATSFTSFPKSIVPQLGGRDVFICTVESAEIEPRLAAIDAAFIASRVPPPKRLFKQEWEQISEVLSKEVDQADTAMISYDFKAGKDKSDRSPGEEKLSMISELEKPDPVKEKEKEEVKPWSPLAFVTGLLPAFVKKRGRPAAPSTPAKPKTDVPAHPAAQPTNIQPQIGGTNEDSEATQAPLHRRPARPVK